jgi:hypothetical protein
MSEETEPTCPVCLDALIAPVTIPCGHNTCFHCVTLLNKKCPICRSTYTNECKINLVMDQLLAKIVPNYANRRAEMLRESELTTLFARFKKSTRYSLLLTVIEDQFELEGKATLPLLIDLCQKQSLTPEPTEDEILYILHDQTIIGSTSFVSVVIEGVKYYLCSDPGVSSNARTLIEFTVANKQHLSQTDIYRLASYIDKHVSELFQALNLCEKEDIKWNRENLVKHLSTVQFKELNYSDDSSSEDSDVNSSNEDED